MKSRWYEFKDEVRALRRNGVSMTVIERRYGIPRSTLSGWFRDIELTKEQRVRLAQNSFGDGIAGRLKGAEWNRQQKQTRIETARKEAERELDKIELSDAVLDLALAMLYWGEGAKKDRTALGSSDPKMLCFMVTVLRRQYSVTTDMLRCDLHLRADQVADEMKLYWSQQLGLPLECFRYVAFDKRTKGRKTYEHYKGVCLVTCGDIAIQRKLIYLYNLFCDKVMELDKGT